MAYPAAPRGRKRIEVPLEVEVEARPAPFHLNRNVRYLDVARIAKRAEARIEIGYVEAGCGRNLVHALVRKGMVVALEMEGTCAKRRARDTKLSAPVRRRVDEALAKLASAAPSAPKLPLPLKELTSSQAASIQTWTCWRICFVLFGARICATCCTGRGPGKGPQWTVCGSTIDVLPIAAG